MDDRRTEFRIGTMGSALHNRTKLHSTLDYRTFNELPLTPRPRS
jgi:hypothetical protein